MSKNETNTQVLLKARPSGPLTTDLFEVVETPIPEPGPGEFLLETVWLSVDPFMVSRMRSEANYAAGVGLGEVMQAYSIGRVVASNHPDYPVGHLYAGLFGLRAFAQSDGSNVAFEVDPDQSPISRFLGVLGMPGLTAYFGLLEVGEPKEGETVVVSACSGAVGGFVGQIAKIKGCRAVGITSTEEKRRFAMEEFGFDEVVLYKDAEGRQRTRTEISENLAQACPDGIDVYFDNVGGEIYEATLPVFRVGGRIIVCGRVSTAELDDTSKDVGPRDNGMILVKRLRKQGFLVFDYNSRREEGVAQLSAWLDDGRLRYSEDILDGIEKAPEAFIRMMKGQSKGKQLVRAAPVNA